MQPIGLPVRQSCMTTTPTAADLARRAAALDDRADDLAAAEQDADDMRRELADRLADLLDAADTYDRLRALLDDRTEALDLRDADRDADLAERELALDLRYGYGLRRCEQCAGALLAGARADARYCGPTCRSNARHARARSA